MKDIKSLYQAAKYSGNVNDISAYKEAVNDLLKSNPNDYVLQLEYIIKSGIGLKTFKPFIETYGLPIVCHEYATELLTEYIENAKYKHVDYSLYEETLNMLNDIRSKYIHCFMMESYYYENIREDYVKTYYGTNRNGIQNRKLIAGLIKEFGEAAIPDIIITANEMGVLESALSYIEKTDMISKPLVCEWITESIKPLYADESLLATFESKSVSTIINEMRVRNNNLYKESMIMGNINSYYEYEEYELAAVTDMISLLEYKMTWCDELGESITECQNEIYSLYEECDDIEPMNESVADAILPMLPHMIKPHHPELDDLEHDTNEDDYVQKNNTKHYHHESSDNTYTEKNWFTAGSITKKDGKAPKFLADTTDLSYGEDDKDKDDSSTSSSSDHETLEVEPTLDDLRRPEVGELDSPDGISEPNEEKDDKDGKIVASPSSGSSTNNYYYYTYNNSLNKNTHSFNRDNSSHDDHSNNKGDNRSDNRNYSHDNTFNNGVNKESTDNEEYTEAVGDADDNRPESDHPVKDALQEIDKKTIHAQQKVKYGVQNVQNVGRAFMKPINRTRDWVTKMVHDWKDKDEAEIKAKMCDPYERKNLFKSLTWCIKTGAVVKAGLLLNPVYLFLTISKKYNTNKNMTRMRNEVIADLKSEIQIIDEKIQQADREQDFNNKYKLMRLKNEINKKLLRVGGNKNWKKLI